MKKAIFIIALVLLGMTGCGQTQSTEPISEEFVQYNSAKEIPAKENQSDAENNNPQPDGHEIAMEKKVQRENLAETAQKPYPTEDETVMQSAEEVSQPYTVIAPEVSELPAEEDEVNSTESPESVSEDSSIPEREQPSVENEEPELDNIEEVESKEPEETDEIIIDHEAIAAYARAYAASLGFVIDTSLGTGNAGYYPPDCRLISSMQDGYNAAVGMVAATKNQLNSRFSVEHSGVLVEEAYGLARANCQVVYSHTDEVGSWYYIYVFYG